MKALDKRFDEITIKEIPLKITEAFLELETEIRITPLGVMCPNEEDIVLIKEKANQMKLSINNFIDSQLKRIIDASENLSSNECLNSEEQGEIQNQQQK